MDIDEFAHIYVRDCGHEECHAADDRHALICERAYLVGICERQSRLIHERDQTIADIHKKLKAKNNALIEMRNNADVLRHVIAHLRAERFGLNAHCRW